MTDFAAYATLAYLAVGALVAVWIYWELDQAAAEDAPDDDATDDLAEKVGEARRVVGDQWLSLMLAVSALVWPVLVVAWAWGVVEGWFGRE